MIAIGGGRQLSLAGTRTTTRGQAKGVHPAYRNPPDMTLFHVGRYQVVNCLSSNEGAAVYRAIDPLLERTVALKIIQAQFDAGAAERLFQVARNMARLDCPYILKFLDMGIDVTAHPQRHYIVMEYAEGGLLADVGPQNRWEYFDQLLKAIEHAHRRHVVHGNLKPENILIAGTGVKVANFGLGPLVGMEPSRYSPPELATGVEGGIQGDIFSLGVILSDFLGGAEALEAIVTRAASRQPESRYPSVWHMHCALNAARHLPLPPLEPHQPSPKIHSSPPYSPAPYPA